VTGLDLAADSIRLAREHERPGLRFGRHDMRAAFGDETFDCVFNLFTSFGYFERADEHLAVVRNVSRSLKAGGRFVLDFLNVKRAEAQLTPHEMVVRDGVRYAIARWADADHIFKRIDVHAADGSSPRTYLERVAKFTLEDFRLMFALYGLRAEEIYGDYELGRFDVETSPRLIVVARKTDDTAKADYLRERFLRMRLNVSGETPRYEASMR
jgi:SAM-dependent methyltransferase